MKNISYLAIALLLLTSCSAMRKEAQNIPPAPQVGIVTPAPAEIAPLADEELEPPKDGVAGSYLASRAALENSDFTASAQFLKQALDADPQNISLIERAAVISVMGGDVGNAMKLAERWTQKKPGATLPAMMLFLRDAKAGQYAKAGDYLKILESGRLNKLTAPLLRAWLNAAEKNTPAAFASLQPILAHETAGGIVLLHAALIAEYARDFTLATSYAEQALARFTTPPVRLVLSAGSIFERAGESGRAKALYDDFNTRNPGNRILDAAYERLEKGGAAPANLRTAEDGIAQVLFDIASSFEGQQSNESAMVYAQLSNYMNPDFEFNRLLLSELYESYGQTPKATAIYKTLASHPIFGWPSSLRLARNYEKAGDYKSAIALLEAMRKSHPDRIEASTLLGDVYREMKDHAGAIEAYSEAIDKAPKTPASWPLYYARGTAFEQAKMWPQAEKDLQQALSMSPDQPYVLNYLAYSWVERGEKLDQAKTMLQRAVELAPNDGFIVDSLGWLYYKTGDYNAAIETLQKSVEIRPFDPQLIDHYGDALWRGGNQEQARIQWQRALSFNPEKDLRAALEEKMKSGLSDEKIKQSRSESTAQ